MDVAHAGFPVGPCPHLVPLTLAFQLVGAVIVATPRVDVTREIANGPGEVFDAGLFGLVEE